MNFSFANLQAANLATSLVARVNAQIGQTATLDEQPEIDQAPGQRGEVLLDQPDSFVQLSYDPSSNVPKAFAFKANENLSAADGTVVVAAGTETSYSAAADKETFRLHVPVEGGVAKQEAVLDNQAQMLLLSDGSVSVEVPFSVLPAAQATSALVQKLQLQIQQTAEADEQQGTDKAIGKPGQVMLEDEGSAVSLSVDMSTGLPQAFSFQATQNLAAADGTVVLAAGTATRYQRQGNIETFSQDIPTDQGVVRQQAVLDNEKQTVEFDEFILNP